MAALEFLKALQRLQMSLYSFEFNRWVETQSESDKNTIRDLRTRINVRITEIQNYELEYIADWLDQAVPGMEEGITCLQREIRQVKDLREIAEFLDRIVEAVPGVIP
jgi:hypothetical protein